jgi:predicted Holliday junction resolvase-like endonuclease|tara:strand:- start:34812 stop:35222 length:411 start_codon:yes stop_codon:yes gene_type:complete
MTITGYLTVAFIFLMFMAFCISVSRIYNSQAACIKKLNDDNTKLLSQKKSSETRLGQIGEHFAPFLDVFPYDPKEARFLGSPIDFVVFDFEGDQIVLVEFKTGNSRESKRQRQVRDMVAKGSVKYEVIRVRGGDEA